MLSPQHITIFDGKRVLAEADVDSGPDLVQARLRVESGHLPPGTRTQLVDAVLDLTTGEPGVALEMTLPAGDAEMLQRVRERCHGVDAHAAGASCRLHTTIPSR